MSLLGGDRDTAAFPIRTPTKPDKLAWMFFGKRAHKFYCEYTALFGSGSGLVLKLERAIQQQNLCH